MSVLFEPLTLRGVTFPNRVWMAPMCQYSADVIGDQVGVPNDWHRTHLASRAIGGVGLILTEATAVSPEGRISPADLGIWNERQARAFAEINAQLAYFGAVPGIQLAHAGRKASTKVPWRGGRSLDADDRLSWNTVAPSAVAFGDYTPPTELTTDAIAGIVADFAAAATRALQAEFKVVEIHAAHGYLIHQFLSPLSNKRTDHYGGSFENRIRFLLEILTAVREVWPAELPLFVRVSATDWVERRDGEFHELSEERGLEVDSWTADQTVALANILTDYGVDLVDVSTGGNSPGAQIPVGPGYQVPFARRIQNESLVPAAAVGLITEPEQAEEIIEDGSAVAVLLGRELLRDPYWARRAARELNAEVGPRVPSQYARAY
ncbi:NADH:flavin oxidoreductase/NADH oxidase [Rhodococcus sp. KBS0724]|uniref:NADH:flavin oxidoreductase/NADH oxidase n=1 Tax=Rhodococcus sp. KBS0724 TaxID=1179674 RepID=UPI00110F1E86|nr:NADH:flavin oxidoreductase/NADH oxidase [Rhodococcus sp. KBS0724]TSD46506.1 NADH:flavin oxidoreductase/NADH oxidase [Rhodococcus sp. KBS0724]